MCVIYLKSRVQEQIHQTAKRSGSARLGDSASEARTASPQTAICLFALGMATVVAEIPRNLRMSTSESLHYQLLQGSCDNNPEDPDHDPDPAAPAQAMPRWPDCTFAVAPQADGGHPHLSPIDLGVHTQAWGYRPQLQRAAMAGTARTGRSRQYRRTTSSVRNGSTSNPALVAMMRRR